MQDLCLFRQFSHTDNKKKKKHKANFQNNLPRPSRRERLIPQDKYPRRAESARCPTAADTNEFETALLGSLNLLLAKLIRDVFSMWHNCGNNSYITRQHRAEQLQRPSGEGAPQSTYCRVLKKLFLLSMCPVRYRSLPLYLLCSSSMWALCNLCLNILPFIYAEE